MSTLKNILKVGLAAAVIYGAYKLGQVSKKEVDNNGNIVEDEVKDVENLISQIESKPTKTKKDKDVLDLLKIKLNQLLNATNPK